ncbi:NADP-dependent oxidoreductase [Nonomuraea sp. LP-02]|uniref:NADP-dependent oxidoreductase n=1 Tax=Nonomuraea sp. LP-02 TaxID=3097960 RepID=UPI002E311B04|nr:NADP-dependent oxidoreductase [Nonomuraea sp. LP-02]MED7931677.1 NADP-dependent oxidoreductase [Nonomuraea sp. LP-02]
MRTVRIDRFGDPDVLTIAEAPAPRRLEGEVLVRVVASAINPVDDKTRQGAIGEGTPPLPMTLGWELAGIVVDSPTSRLPVGERVFGMSHQLGSGRGTWADLVALPVGSLAAAPSRISLVEAATLPLPGLTALQTLDWLDIRAGERLLVAGAVGAVGGLAVQLARARGARVDALVSRPAQVEVAKELGAEWATTERATLPVAAYDAVFDTFGAFVTEAVADEGRYASIATQAGPVPDLSHRAVRTTVNQVREDGAGLAELARMVDAGQLKVRVDSEYSLQRVQEAHERFLRGQLAGKIALIL